jgi:subtilisin family serine protease
MRMGGLVAGLWLLAAQALAQQRPVPVFIVLSEQPQRAALDRAWATFAVRAGMAEAARETARQRIFVNPWEQVDAQRAVDDTLVAERRHARLEIQTLIGGQQRALLDWLAGNGSRRIGRYSFANLLTAEVPAELLDTLRAMPSVAAVFPVQRLRPQLSQSVPALGATTFWTNGFTGAGESVGVLDTGLKANHPAFVGLNVVNRAFLSWGKNDDPDGCFADDVTSTDDLQGHGTHVAGIVASQGSAGFTAYQGVAKGLSSLYNLKVAFVTGAPCPVSGLSDSRDVLDAIDYVTGSTPVRVLNYSFGSNPEGASDDGFARELDRVADLYGLTLTIAAGNEGPALSTIASPAYAYNVLAVANWASRGSMSDSSSRGPTANNRFKPDIAAPGSSIYSTNNLWQTASHYRSLSGTSMAAPHMAGAAALLRGAGVTNALAVKALLLNTTDNTGWAVDRGWGYANLTRLWSQRYWAANSLAAGAYRLYQLPASSSLRTAVVWNRHIPVVLPGFNDIDLAVFSAANGASLGVSDTGIQNVEQVSVAPTSGAIVKVEMFSSTLAGGVAAEPYAIAFSEPGTVLVSPPNLSLSCSAPTNATPGQTVTVTCNATNTGGAMAFSATAQFSLPAGFSGGGALSFGNIPAGGVSGLRSSTVTVGTAGAYTIGVNLSSASYFEAFTATASLGLQVATPPPVPPANDTEATATVLGPLPVTLQRDVRGATASTTDPVHSCTGSQDTATVWFQHTAATTGPLEISTAGSTYSPILAVYAGTPADPNSELACAPPGRDLTIAAVSGRLYYIQVSAPADTAPATLSLTLGAGVDARKPTALYRNQYRAIDALVLGASAPVSAGGVFGSEPAADQTPAGDNIVMGRDPSGAIWGAVFSAGQVWTAWRSSGGQFVGDPAVAYSPSAGKAWVAARDRANGYWLNSFTPGPGFGAWVPLGGVFSTDPVIAVTPGGSVYIAGKDTYQGVWFLHVPNGGQPESWTFIGGVIKGKLSSTAGRDGALYLAGRDNWDAAWLARVEAGSPAGWIAAGGLLATDPLIASTGGGMLCLAASDAGSSVWYRQRAEGKSTTWQPWRRPGGLLTTLTTAHAGADITILGRDQRSQLWWLPLSVLQWTQAPTTATTAGPVTAAPR